LGFTVAEELEEVDRKAIEGIKEERDISSLKECAVTASISGPWPLNQFRKESLGQ
jgi:hypothetical protein